MRCHQFDDFSHLTEKKGENSAIYTSLNTTVCVSFHKSRSEEQRERVRRLIPDSAGGRGVTENRQLQPGEPPTDISGERLAIETHTVVE